jgi:nucleoid-associated protein YgaU
MRRAERRHGGRGNARRLRVLGLGLLLGWAAIAGCSRAPQVELPAADSGRFLTLDEQRALSPGQLKQYCAMLDGYLAELREDVELARALQDSLTAVADSLQTEQLKLGTESRRIEREVAEMKTRRGGPVIYEVKEGDTLTSLATLFYGATAEWRKIYEANKEKIDDPQQPLRPGLRVTIP